MLARPRDGRIEQAGDADPVRHSTFDRGFDEARPQEGLAAIETRLNRRFNNSTQSSIASTPSWANSKTAKSTSASNSKSASSMSRSISASLLSGN
jgi:hypothetical protein